MLTAIPSAEANRLAALASYGILDTEPEDDFDSIAQIAAHVCEAPLSQINFLTDEWQWSKASHGGLGWQTLPRHLTFCSYAIKHPSEVLIVPDTRADARFQQLPQVTGEANLQFYAGVALVDDEGYVLGTLCVADHEPRQLSEKQAGLLKSLARQVVSLLQLRRNRMRLEKAGQRLHTLNTEMQDRNQMLKTVVDTCAVGLVLWQAIREQGRIVDFRFDFTNPQNAYIVGLSQEHMTGRLLKSPQADTLPRFFFERLVEVVETRRAQRFYQHYLRADQRLVWGDVTLTPCGDGVLLTCQDITNLKETEEQLRQSTADLNRLVAERTAEIYQLSALQHAILHYAGMAIVSTNALGQIETVNPAAERLVGYQSHELMGRCCHDMLHPVLLDQQFDEQETYYEELINNPIQGKNSECCLKTKDGREVPVLLTSTAILDELGDVSGYVHIAIDITRQKEVERVLQQSLQREQDLNRMKSQFVRTASHEFRTPLATIQSSVELIKLYLEKPLAESAVPIQRHVAIIEKQIVNYSELLSDVLTMGRVEAGRIAFNPKPVQLLALVSDVISMHYTDRADGRTVDVEVVGTPYELSLDTTLIKHVLVNLLSNAMKFSAHNPQLRITFGEEALTADVIDQGIGIPADDMAQLFESFFRARNTINIQGSGLGLVIAREFVMLHGGDLQIRSQEGVGTTSTITLPL